MRISDWSSDVCSSDLLAALGDHRFLLVAGHHARVGDDLASALGLQRRQLDVEQVAGVEDRQGERAGACEGCRQVDVQVMTISAVAARIAGSDVVAPLFGTGARSVCGAAEAN